MQDSQSELDNIFLSYDKILIKLKQENITTKNNKEITHKDLRVAVNIMIKKHPTCRWKSEKINSRKYFVLKEGYYWLVNVYFQKDKLQIDADIEFFEKRIEQYRQLLKIKEEKIYFKDIAENKLESELGRKKDTINKYLKKLENENSMSYIIIKNNNIYISSKGMELLYKRYFKQKYLSMLEEYKMYLTEKYIEAGYPYDNFFGKN